MIVVAQGGGPVETRTDEIDPVPAGDEPRPQTGAVATGNVVPVGDGVAQGHHLDPAVGLGPGG